MVAARGYSLANAFLMAAIAVPVWHHVKGGLSLRRSCALGSLALGLSFSANFSFAFVDGAVFLLIAAWAIRRRGEEHIGRILEVCILPGLFIATLLCGYMLLKLPRGEFTYGAKSMAEMTNSLVNDSLFQLDPHLEGTGLYAVMDFLKPVMLPALGLLCLCQLAITRVDGSWLRDAWAKRRGRFAAALAYIVALTILLHWLAFQVNHLPLPMGRTGIYLVPLITLMAGIIAAVTPGSKFSRWGQRGIVTVFVCLACYFLFCLRLTYFQEWKWDAEVKDVYSVLAGYNQKYGVNDAGVSWYYTSAMNFYRVSSKGGEHFPEFVYTLPDPPLDKSVYVLHGVFEREFLERQNLVVVYRGKLTDVVLAVKRGGVVPVDLVER